MLDALKLTGLFAVMVFLLMRRANMGAVMLGSAVFLGLLFEVGLPGFWQAAVQTVSNTSNLELVVALTLIMLMEHIMGDEGILHRMVGALRGLVRDSRLVMITLPALVGLMPGAGGAIFSAPMVEEVSRGSGVTAERKAFVNFWYRHIWEFILPLYPSLLLAAKVLDVPLGSIIPLMLPVPLIAVLSGWQAAFGGVRFPARQDADPEMRQHVGDLIAGLGPIFVVLALVLGLGLTIAPAVAVVLVGLLVVYRYTPPRLAFISRKAISLNVLSAMLGVLAFKEMLVVSKAVGTLTPVLTDSHVPLAWFFAGLPFLVGLLTGSPAAAAGTSAPILVSLLAPLAVPPVMAAMAVVSGYCGCLLSPAHLCLVLTVGYFRADMAKVYRLLVVPVAALTGLSLGYLALL